MYRIVLHALNGDPIEEVPAKNLQFSYVLNAPGAISFVLPIRDEKCTKYILDPGKREIKVWRDKTLVWGGYLWSAQAGEEDTMRFSGEGWFSKLRRRYIDSKKKYTAQDQFTIAWDLIDFTQTKTGGNLGITRFSAATSGVTRDRTYQAWERKNVGEALEELAAVQNGFDFEITSDKQWKTYYPKKTASGVHDFVLGKNIRGFAIDYDANETDTEITAMGDGEEAKMLLSVAVDTAARTEFGLLQDTRDFRDISKQSTLDAHATEELRLAKIQRVQPNIQVFTDDPPWGSFAVGDNARLDIKKGYVQLEQVFRITTITVQVSDEGNEAVGVFFGEEGQA